MRPLSAASFLALILMLGACTGAAGAPPTPDAAPPANGAAAPVLSLSPVAPAEQPWGMAFLPDGGLLFTEKEGGLKFVMPGADAAPASVTGLPAAYTAGQAGYLGLALAPDFATSRRVYVALSEGTDDANSTIVVHGRLSPANDALTEVTQIFTADRRDTPLHYGARLAFAPDGTLFVTLGDGFKYKDKAQDTGITHGKIVRINADGTIPADNPFADGTGGKPSVWSYGHRNVQGLAFAPDGTLWATEHGPKGGDELNIITRGANYGWPKATFGVNYDGTLITRETTGAGFTDPQSYWVPSIAPAGLAFLTSDVYPGWKGDLFAGGMNGPDGMVLVRIDMAGGKIAGREALFKDEISVRDVVQGPDGHLYLAHKDFDGIFRVDVAG